MSDFLAKLPPLLSTISKAFLAALKQRIVEIARAVRAVSLVIWRLCISLSKWLWKIYYELETSIIAVIVHIALTIIAAKLFILLIIIGVSLVYFEKWIILLLYLIFISIAVLGSRFDKDAFAQECNQHNKYHVTLIKKLRVPIRIIISIMYFSYNFIDIGSIKTLLSHEDTEEPYTLSFDSHKSENIHKVDQENQQHKNINLEDENAQSEESDTNHVEYTLEKKEETEEKVEQQSVDHVMFTAQIIGTEELNVRSEPGAEFTVVKKLKAGTEVEVYRKNNGWSYIGYGWVNSKYITNVDTIEEDQKHTNQNTPKNIIKDIYYTDDKKYDYTTQQEAAYNNYLSTSNTSFNCTKARKSSEITICNNADIGQMDKEMASLYHSHLNDYKNDIKIINKLRETQRNWLIERNRCGLNATCLIAQYQERISWLREFEAYD